MRPLSRIFALAPDCHAKAGRYRDLWRRHFYDGIAAVASETVRPSAQIDFGWARPAARAPEGFSEKRTRVSEQLWEAIRDGGFDAVISYCFASDIDVALVRRTVQMGIPWVNFYCDSVYAFDRVEPLAREVSLNWFPETAATAPYRATGKSALCRPYALNPAALPYASCTAAIHGAGFVGAPTGNRVLYLAAFAALGCPVAVRGEGWGREPSSSQHGRGSAGTHSEPRRDLGRRALPPTALLSRVRAAMATIGRLAMSATDVRASGRVYERVLLKAVRPMLRAGGRLDDDELTRFVAGCRVVIGLNEGRDLAGRYRSYLKFRDLEFPGYGACYLTQHNEDIERAFDVGREVLTFRHLSEGAAIARDCIAHASRAREIGEAGRRRVLAEHTWAVRLGEIAQAL